MVSLDIIVGAETTKNTRVKWTSQDWSCLAIVYVGSNIMFLSYGPYIGMFLLPNLKKKIKKRNCKPVLNNLKQKKKKQCRGFLVWRNHWTGLCSLKPENVSPSCRDIIVSMLWEITL